MVKKTGIDLEIVSSHSFRRGGAAKAFKAQVPAEFTKLQGDWASDAYKKYLKIPSKFILCDSIGKYIRYMTQTSYKGNRLPWYKY